MGGRVARETAVGYQPVGQPIFTPPQPGPRPPFPQPPAPQPSQNPILLLGNQQLHFPPNHVAQTYVLGQVTI